MHKLFRRGLRKMLFCLSHWALRKHRPQVIAVVGEGKTGIAREAIYQVLKKGRYPVRRNIEAPEAEFVLPLIILGAEEYPHSYLGWLKVLLKSLGQLILRPAHEHLLVLEIGYSNKEIFDFFWKLTHPSVLVICGEAPFLAATQRAKHTIKVAETGNLKPHLGAAVKVAKLFDIKEEKAHEALAHFSLPTARIRILPSKASGIVVDATYQYYPPSEEALDEILAALPGKRIFFDPKTLRQAQGKLIKSEIKKGEVGILLGPKKKMWPILLELAKVPWFD